MVFSRRNHKRGFQTFVRLESTSLIIDMASTKSLSPDDYTVGWVCALPLEMAAARAMLDEEHDKQPKPWSDNNSYVLGEIYGHNIVITCLPSGVYGTTSAAVVASQMLSTFPSIRFGLLVGIGGGVPSRKNDIRLGDIVVSKPVDTIGGVVRYDSGKVTKGGRLERSGMLNKPPPVLLTALSQLQANHMTKKSRIPAFLVEARKKFEWTIGQDNLFEADYDHVGSMTTCVDCDKNRLILRDPRGSQEPMIFYGLIASGDLLIKDGQTRDRIAQELGVICFEMEAAGLMDHFPCVVIRGISDYSDSHKNKAWQNYAAATAAAYAKELLSVTSINLARSSEPANAILQAGMLRYA